MSIIESEDVRIAELRHALADREEQQPCLLAESGNSYLVLQERLATTKQQLEAMVANNKWLEAELDITRQNLTQKVSYMTFSGSLMLCDAATSQRRGSEDEHRHAQCTAATRVRTPD